MWQKRLKTRGKPSSTHKIIRCPAPSSCFRCGGETLYKHRECSKTVVDLKFGGWGIKRWITKYLFDLYRCPVCRAVFRNHDLTWTNKKFGDDLRAFIVYQTIGLGMPQQKGGDLSKEVPGLILAVAR